MIGLGQALALLAVAALLLVPTTAAADPPWDSTQAISGLGAASEPALAVNDAGTATAVWSQSGLGDTWNVYAARREFAGAWDDRMLLGTVDGGALGPGVDVATDANGNAVAVWTRPEGSGGVVLAAIFNDAIGRWSEGEVISGDDDEASGPRVVMTADSSVVAAWSGRPAGSSVGTTRAAAAVRPAVSAAWGPPEAVATAPAFLADLLVSQDGQQVATVSTLRSGNANGSFETSVRLTGGSWSAPESLTIPGAGVPSLAFGPDGALVAVAARFDETARFIELAYADRPARGSWSAPRRLEAGDAVHASDLQLVVDDAGVATLLWRRTQARSGGEGTFAAASVSRRPAEGEWGRASDLSPADRTIFSPRLDQGPSGATVAVWQHDRPAGADGLNGLYASLRPTAGTGWGAPERIVATRDQVPAIGVAVDASGRALVAWRGSQDGGQVVRSAARDAGIPGRLRLTRRQLLINQRISQAALRRIAAIEGVLNGGIAGERVRRGALLAKEFSAQTGAAGVHDGLFSTPVRTPIEVAAPDRSSSAVSLTRSQLLINQRVSQAAVRRVRALETRLASGVTSGDITDGAIGAGQLASGITISDPQPTPGPLTPTRSVVRPGSGGSASSVRLSAGQLVINQRISRGAVRRVNALLASLELGLTGDQIQDSSLRVEDLAAELR